MTEVTTDEYSDSHFYSKILKIGAPIILAQFMTSILGLIDTLMVSSLGEIAVAAVGVSTSFMFLLFMILFGLLSGLSIFVSQFWGGRDIKSIHKIYLISLIVTIIMSSTFFILGKFFPEFIIGLYDNSDNVSESIILTSFGTQYLSIATFSYFTMSASFMISMWMRAVEKVIYPQAIAIGVVLLNTLLNYALIKGNFGFEAYGVKGAATATLISSSIGATLLILYLIKSKEEVFKIKLSCYKEISKKFLKKVFEKALPVAINEAMWGLGMTVYVIAYGFIGTATLASIHVSNQVMGLFWVFTIGISTACSIMVGVKLGENKLDLAKKWGIKFTKLTFGLGIVFGISLFLFSDLIAEIFTKEFNNDTVRENVTLILKVFAFYIPIKYSNALQIIGTLRAGGDTKFVLFAEIVPLWFIGVPLAFILSIYTDLPLYIIVGLVNIEEIVKFFIVIWRFYQFKWVRNLTLE